MEVKSPSEIRVVDMYYKFPSTPLRTGEEVTMCNIQSATGKRTFKHPFAHPIPEPDKQQITAWFQTHFTPIAKDMMESGIEEVQSRLSNKGLSAYIPEYWSSVEPCYQPDLDPTAIIKSYIDAVSIYCTELQYTNALRGHILMGRLLGFHEKEIEALVSERLAHPKTIPSWQDAFARAVCKKVGISAWLHVSPIQEIGAPEIWCQFESDSPVDHGCQLCTIS